MTMALQWIALSLFTATLAGSGLAAWLALGAWSRFKARNRRAIKVFVENEACRQARPLSVKLERHDLEIELLKAFYAELRRDSRPALRIADPADGPDAAA